MLESNSTPSTGANTHSSTQNPKTETHHFSDRQFSQRHIGPSKTEQQKMLSDLGFKSFENFLEKTIPSSIRTQKDYSVGQSLSEAQLLEQARKLASENKVNKSYIGMGYYNTHTPSVILRNVVENPGWYTAYTPYQAEISQGRMEALLNFQTMVSELTAMPIANSSLLDEGTAAAEAMALAFNLSRKKKSTTFFVDKNCFPQTIEVLKTRSKPLGIQLLIADFKDFDFSEPIFGAIVQYPNKTGQVSDFKEWTQKVQSQGGLSIVATDLLALCHLQPPGEWGADIVLGNSQRFGVPMGFGGPHAAFFATKDEFKRSVPGRFIGVSKDSQGSPALRLALQTREQHIRRERATSNICTSQVLLAVVASMYAVYHGPQRLQSIAKRVHKYTCQLFSALQKLGYQVTNSTFFDTLTVDLKNVDSKALEKQALSQSINLNFSESGQVGISIDETTTDKDLIQLINLFSELSTESLAISDINNLNIDSPIKEMLRTSEPLKHEIFKKYHSESEMMRYLNRLQSKDISLVHSMIPLGSCTMKLNAATEMEPITWPEFNSLHPFAPKEQYNGYSKMIHQLENWLADLTGFDSISLQPNAGSQGEYAGLLVIQKYHESRGDTQRTVCLIPSSAHGTNPASAVMAGLKVVVIKCDDQGNIDIEDLKSKAEQYQDQLSSLMITYPSTHGVFEESIKEICSIIHANGGQVYMDGANMNAMVGLCRPGEIGADVAHLNLHKTFCIPHGGGGPGMGPIGVAEHLTAFLPNHPLNDECGPKTGVSAVSSAPWGSPSILPISWAYIAMMGNNGLREATEVAILNANYIAHRLKNHYDVLYKGQNGFVAHECIIDTRPFKKAGITVDDIAKRLMDYGFHAPTMSWPVAGTLMIEPTESESREELDRFCDAMISIREEIKEVEEGQFSAEESVLRNAPHSQLVATSDEWSYKYSRKKAIYPLSYLRNFKVWPAVGRVDNAYGDKNFMCSCPPLEEY